MDEMKLEPCPFCGEAPLEGRIEPHEHTTMILGHVPIPYSYPGSWSVECVKCECRIFSHESRERAIERWNRRQPQSAEWVPWKEGDPLPPAGRYLVSRIQGREHVTEVATSTPEVVKGELRWWPLKFSNGRVIAYIPQRLPDPYTDAQGKRLPEREECEK